MLSCIRSSQCCPVLGVLNVVLFLKFSMLSCFRSSQCCPVLGVLNVVLL